MDEVLYTWGWGKYGQLGHGNEANQAVPKPVDMVTLQGQTVSQLSCGFCYNIALTKKGDIFTWGYGKHMQLGHPELNFHVLLRPRRVKFFHRKNVRAVAAGREHSVAVLMSGDVYTWGCGVFGRLGHGDENNHLEPKLVEFFQSPTKSLGISSEDKTSMGCLPEEEERGRLFIVGIACGLQHSLALDDSGNVYSWGMGLKGRLGHGDEENQMEPKLVKALAEEGVKCRAVHCGWDHSAIISKDKGHVYTWGCGRSFQLGGIGLGGGSAGADEWRARPTKVIQWIDKVNKSVKATNKPGWQGEFMTRPPRIIELSCGGKHNLALAEDGSVFSWGRGEFGRLGHGDQRHKIYPTKIQALVDLKIVSVAGGGYHSMALGEDGSVYVWGNNEHGRLGLGNLSELYVSKPTLLPISNPHTKAHTHFTKIAAGAFISIGLGSSTNPHLNSSMYNQCNLL